jgi:hypothetical protein
MAADSVVLVAQPGPCVRRSSKHQKSKTTKTKNMSKVGNLKVCNAVDLIVMREES